MKNLAVLATVSMLALSVSCSDRYQEGFDKGKTEGYAEGYDVGYDSGYADGDEAGFERAKAYFATANYNAGFTAGNTAGIATGYNQGYSVGKQDGKTEGYTLGYNTGKVDGRAEGSAAGYDMGYDDGYADGGAVAYTTGYNDGKADGYDLGYTDGSADGYQLGYDNGFGDGYDFGYSDGFDDGFALSVGKSKKLKGYANLLSMAHNDIFDYSKIKAPKQTSRGLVANGELLLSEVSITNKDTLKRAAVVEQYLVMEMAKQVKSKFGLSAERSLKVAKAANHFRKYSSKRALTSEDTNAYATEIIGSDLSTIEKAYSQSMKGDVSGLKSVLKQAAEKNNTTPENMASIVSEMFI